MPFLGDALPMIGRNALAADPAGHRDELHIEIFDPQLVDHLANLGNLFGAPGCVYKGFEIRHHTLSR